MIEPVKPGYKLTEVGVIPEDWEVKHLNCVAEIIDPQPDHRTPPEMRGGIPYIGISDFINDSFVDWEGCRKITAIALNKQQKSFTITPNDIIFGKIGTIGEPKFVPLTPYPFALSANVILIKPQIHPQLLISWLKSSLIWKQINQDLHSTSQAAFGILKARKLLLAIPSKRQEQQSIATALSETDALIGSLDRLIAKKRDLKQAAMQQLLTGKTRLTGFTGKWEVNPLRRYVKQFIVPMRDKPKHFLGDIPWCRIEDFDGVYLSDSKSAQRVDLETIRNMNLKIYPVGTLLVSCSADLGRCALVSQPLISNQTFIGLEIDENIASNLFFYYFMISKAEELNTLSSGTTISYLSREQFEEFSVFTPNDKTEQTAIATILSDMDTEIAALEQRRNKTRAIKQGMMQELLTGRIRLIDDMETQQQDIHHANHP